MSRRPIFVLADDLTGAAEMAAIAHQAGLRAVVHTVPPSGRLDADVIVCNTETRLLTPIRAARRVREITAGLRRTANVGFFKKTDSVLRGPVLAEIRACATELGRGRVVLVPCNPSLGRVIRGGRYFLGGQPLHKTAFARDPHHPRTSAEVRVLLGATDDAVICCPPSSRLPAAGVVVGEADTPADMTFWAGQVDRRTLAAGGADFFRAWLQSQGARGLLDPKVPVLEGPTLLLSGTATPPEPVTPLPGRVVEVRARRIPKPAALAETLAALLEQDRFASVAMRGALSRNRRTPALLIRLFTQLAERLHRSDAFHHVLTAGGETASSVLAELGWTKLHVIRVWGPGCVTLRPAAAPGYAVTLKPGSYPWPSSLARYFDEADDTYEHVVIPLRRDSAARGRSAPTVREFVTKASAG